MKLTDEEIIEKVLDDDDVQAHFRSFVRSSIGASPILKVKDLEDAIENAYFKWRHHIIEPEGLDDKEEWEHGGA